MTWIFAAWRWIAGSRAGQAVAAALAALAYLALAKRQSRLQGRSEAEQEAREDADKRVQKGQDAVRDGRGGDPDERLRKNDGRW